MSGENYIEMPIERLNARGKELTLAIRGEYLSGERRIQVQSELSNLAFEMWHRHSEGEFEFDYTE
jgi:hypothetical protein